MKEVFIVFAIATIGGILSLINGWKNDEPGKNNKKARIITGLAFLLVLISAYHSCDKGLQSDLKQIAADSLSKLEKLRIDSLSKALQKKTDTVAYLLKNQVDTLRRIDHLQQENLKLSKTLLYQTSGGNFPDLFPSIEGAFPYDYLAVYVNMRNVDNMPIYDIIVQEYHEWSALEDSLSHIPEFPHPGLPGQPKAETRMLRSGAHQDVVIQNVEPNTWKTWVEYVNVSWRTEYYWLMYRLTRNDKGMLTQNISYLYHGKKFTRQQFEKIIAKEQKKD